MSPATQGCIVLLQVVQFIKEGSTLECPENTPKSVYKAMSSCWSASTAAASGATSTPSRGSWSSSTSISTPRRTSPSCQHRNLQTKSLGKPMCLLFEFMGRGDLANYLRVNSPSNYVVRSSDGSNIFTDVKMSHIEQVQHMGHSSKLLCHFKQI